MKENANEMRIKFSDERTKPIKSKLKVGEWFYIDREVINENKEEIRRKCYKTGKEGELLWKRFEESNKIADENPKQYPNLIETYVFEELERGLTMSEVKDMCKEIGDGTCDEIICDFELQMRICNGESVHDLINEPDKLPFMRIIIPRNGGMGYLGGGTKEKKFDSDRLASPTRLVMYKGDCFDRNPWYRVPYAFRRFSKKEVTTIQSKPEVGKWFSIDRDVINNSQYEIRSKCYEAGKKGELLWERFKLANKCAMANRKIDTYVYKKEWDALIMRRVPVSSEGYGTPSSFIEFNRVLDGYPLCNDVICSLELQMRICNGEPVDDLINEEDHMVYPKIIKDFRNGQYKHIGGKYPPACIYEIDYELAYKWADSSYHLDDYDHERILAPIVDYEGVPQIYRIRWWD